MVKKEQLQEQEFYEDNLRQLKSRWHASDRNRYLGWLALMLAGAGVASCFLLQVMPLLQLGWLLLALGLSALAFLTASFQKGDRDRALVPLTGTVLSVFGLGLLSTDWDVFWREFQSSEEAVVESELRSAGQALQADGRSSNEVDGIELGNEFSGRPDSGVILASGREEESDKKQGSQPVTRISTSTHDDASGSRVQPRQP